MQLARLGLTTAIKAYLTSPNAIFSEKAAKVLRLLYRGILSAGSSEEIDQDYLTPLDEVENVFYSLLEQKISGSRSSDTNSTTPTL